MQKTTKEKENYFILILCAIIPIAVGYLSICFVPGAGKAYEALRRPIFALPTYLFPIVWGILYLFMGLALYRIWRAGQKGKHVQGTYFLFGIQLLLNFFWPILFFRLRLIAIAFFELSLLLMIVILNLIQCFRKDKIASVFLLPYFLWGIYQGILNYFLWIFNM